MTLSGSGLVYTGTFTIPAGDGTVTATVGATDTAGNTLSATGQTGFTIDNTAPTVVLAYAGTNTTSAAGPYKQNDSVTVTATFTETNALYGTPTLTLVANGYSGGTLPAVTLSNGGSGLVYTGTFTIPAGNGPVTASVGTVDTAGNTLSATGQTGFTVDNIGPTYAVTYSRTAPPRSRSPVRTPPGMLRLLRARPPLRSTRRHPPSR
ncbi:MAG: hypothetical protein EB020_15500 [Proteobacteria bacterium]|nr:hypothetical protein [Pseudomonadota bacterium]